MEKIDPQLAEQFARKAKEIGLQVSQPVASLDPGCLCIYIVHYQPSFAMQSNQQMIQAINDKNYKKAYQCAKTGRQAPAADFGQLRCINVVSVPAWKNMYLHHGFMCATLDLPANAKGEIVAFDCLHYVHA